jgi:hypothetical protein
MAEQEITGYAVLCAPSIRAAERLLKALGHQPVKRLSHNTVRKANDGSGFDYSVSSTDHPNPAFIVPALPLLKAVARARRWSDDLISSHIGSVDELARREGIDRRSVRRLIPLGFLSPRVVEAIVEGRQPPDLSVVGLTRRIDLPLLWSAQEQALGLR